MAPASSIEQRVERIDWERDTVKGARIAVDRWFVEIDGRPSFLPGDGAAIPLPREEFLAVRHGAYVKVAELVMSADAWAARMVIGLVVLGVVGGSLAQWPPSPLRTLLLGTLIIGGVARGIYDLYEFVRRFHEVQTVRASVAFALRGRVPERLAVFDRRVRPNPFPVLLAATTFLFLAWLFPGDALGALGLSAYSSATEIAMLAMTLLTGALGAANWWIEARRKG